MATNTYVDPYFLLRDGKRVWVRNMTHPLGVITLTLNDRESVTFPKTKDPICLNDMAPEKSLLESKSLRDLIRKGVLQVVTDEVAQAYFRASGKSPRDAYRVASLPDLRESEFKKELGISELPDQSNTEAPSPSIVHVTLSLQQPNVTDEAAISYLESAWDTMTHADIHYIMSRIGRPNVVRWMALKTASVKETEKALVEEKLQKDFGTPAPNPPKEVFEPSNLSAPFNPVFGDSSEDLRETGDQASPDNPQEPVSENQTPKKKPRKVSVQKSLKSAKVSKNA